MEEDKDNRDYIMKLAKEYESLTNKYLKLQEKHSELQDRHIDMLIKHTERIKETEVIKPNPLKKIMGFINNNEESKIIFSKAGYPIDLLGYGFEGSRVVMNDIIYNGHATIIYKGNDVEPVEIEDVFNSFDEE